MGHGVTSRLIAVLLCGCGTAAAAVAAAPRDQTAVPVSERAPVTFERDVAPLLKKRCDPCHFPGGTKHADLPFDDSKTVRRLGEKLFTRIKADEDRAILRAFFATAP